MSSPLQAELNQAEQKPDHGVSVPEAAPLSVPKYLQNVYWWAYVHPNAVRVFEREWLVNAILFGNYKRLCDVALQSLGGSRIEGKNLQVACVYGDLTPRIVGSLAPDAHLDVVDILPVQLGNLAKKLPNPCEQVALLRADSSHLACEDASYDQVLLFFLLHEQPENVRRATLAEAMRVVKPGGKIVLVDYHEPSTAHPLKLLMRGVFKYLEPFAIDLWGRELRDFLPAHLQPKKEVKKTFFGGLYQHIEWTR